MFSKTILKRFIKDYKLPIQIIQEPYFTYFVDLYDKQYNTKSKINLLTDALSKFESEDKFLSNYYVIRDNIIKTIEATEIYKEFNSVNMDKYNVDNKVVGAKNIFKKTNVDKFFISIDLKKANFQAMKYFSKDLVLGCETYNELISKFTDLEYMKESKYLRQVIFGNINPKRQVKIERYMTEQIYKSLHTILILLDKREVKMICNDEIIFEISEHDANEISVKGLEEVIKQNTTFDVDVEIYQLREIKNTEFYVKEFINKDGYELMCIPAVYHAQAYKKYNNMEIVNNDLVFLYENRACTFLEPLDFDKDSKEENNDEED
jgi:hypothetical protein